MQIALRCRTPAVLCCRAMLLCWIASGGPVSASSPNEACAALTQYTLSWQPEENFIDNAMDEMHSAIADEVRNYVKDMSSSEKRAFRKKVRLTSYKDLKTLPEPIAKAAIQALGPALTTALSQAPLLDAQAKLDRITEVLSHVDIPDPPALPNLDVNPRSCNDLVSAASTLDSYTNRWKEWSVSLNPLADSSAIGIRCGIGPQQMDKYASDLRRQEASVIEIGLLLDSVWHSGTVNATELFSGVRDLSDTAASIAAQLRSLSRRARAKLDAEEPGFNNLTANVAAIVDPARHQKCAEERLERERQSSPTAGSQAKNRDNVQQPPRRTVEIIEWIMTERGYLRRVGTTNSWREEFSNLATFHTFQQQSLNNGTLTVHDASRGYTFIVPLQRNACVRLNHTSGKSIPCYYHVQMVNSIAVQQ